NIVEPDNTDDRNIKGLLYFLDGRKFTLTSLLAVQADKYGGRFCAGCFNNRHNFAHCSPGGNYIVNNQYLSVQGRAYQGAALAVILCLFAVVTVWQILPEMIRQGDGRRRCQRNTFICRTEYHIKIYLRRFDRGSVKAPQLCQGTTGLEAAGIKKIGTD